MKHIQNKSVPDYNTFIGEGRLDEIIKEMQEQGANILILGNIVTSTLLIKRSTFPTNWTCTLIYVIKLIIDKTEIIK